MQVSFLSGNLISHPLRMFLLTYPLIKRYIDLPHLLFSPYLKFLKWSGQAGQFYSAHLCGRGALWGALICWDFGQIYHSSYLILLFELFFDIYQFLLFFKIVIIVLTFDCFLCAAFISCHKNFWWKWVM